MKHKKMNGNDWKPYNDHFIVRNPTAAGSCSAVSWLGLECTVCRLGAKLSIVHMKSLVPLSRVGEHQVRRSMYSHAGSL